MKTAIKILCSDVSFADYTCMDLLLEPETEQELEQNARILEELRWQLGSISAHITAILSTGVDIAPPALPLTAAEFIALVRAGKVRAETPDGDTSRVQIDRAGDGWARIGWDYELYDDVAVVCESFHESMTVDSDTHLQHCGSTVLVNGEPFTLTQEP